MTDYGTLGICFIVLHILGYVSTFLLIIGILLVIISRYINYSNHNTIVYLLIAIFSQLEVEHEEDGL